jgi:hypothetical protein
MKIKNGAALFDMIAEDIPPELASVKADLKKVAAGISESDVKVFAALVADPSSPTKAQVDVIFNIVSSLPDAIFAKLKEGADEKVALAVKIFQGAGKAALRGCANVAVNVIAKFKAMQKANEKYEPKSHHFSNPGLIDSAIFASLIDIYNSLPKELIHNAVAQFCESAPEGDRKNLREVTTIVKKLMNQETSHLVRILAPCWGIAVNISDLMETSGKWDEDLEKQVGSAKQMNELMEMGIQRCSKSVASLHHELTLLPKSI